MLMLYADWAKALKEYFFKAENTGRQISLFVDDGIIAELHSGEPRAAVREFVDAIRSRLGPQGRGNPFEAINREAQVWRRRWPVDSQSPALPLLAASVLAASRMARDDHRGISQTNYYVHFGEIIDRSPDISLQNHYGALMPILWGDLSQWIDDAMTGKYGSSTIPEHPRLSRIGYALSQALFRQSDRDQLPYFFRSIGLSPRAELDPIEALVYFRRWAMGANLSAGAQKLVSSAAYEEQLSQVLVQAAALWDGSFRDEEGRRIGRIAAALYFLDDPRGEVRFYAERPEAFPTELQVRSQTGVIVELKSSGGKWYDVTPIPLPPHSLTTGATMSRDLYSLKLGLGAITPFTQDGLLECWTTTGHFDLGQTHYVVARNHVSSAAERLFNLCAEEGWMKYKAIRGLDPNATLYRNVVLHRFPTVADGADVVAIFPTQSERPHLSGGLVIDVGGRSFLMGGEPDLVLTKTLAAIATTLKVDEEVIRVPPGGGQISLAELGLGAGEHLVSLGPSRLRYFSAESMGRTIPREAGTVGYRFELDSEGRLILDGSGPMTLNRHDPEAIIVTGARVSGPAAKLPPTQAAPIVLPGKRKAYMVLGCRLGMIDQPTEPLVPAWVAEAGLYPSGFEHTPRFPVAWIGFLSSSGKWTMREKDAKPPLTARSQQLTEEERSWCRAILEARGASVDGSQVHWLDYVIAALEAAY